jgi:hypothetical protein
MKNNRVCSIVVCGALCERKFYEFWKTQALMIVGEIRNKEKDIAELCFAIPISKKNTINKKLILIIYKN